MHIALPKQDPVFGIFFQCRVQKLKQGYMFQVTDLSHSAFFASYFNGSQSRPAS